MTATPVSDAASAARSSMRLWRVEISPAPGQPDPHAHQFAEPLAAIAGAQTVRVASSHLYLIAAPLDEDQARQVASQLLCDPIAQRFVLGQAPSLAQGQGRSVEVHYQPGVMDPVAQSTRHAIALMFPDLHTDDIEVRTGMRYDLTGCTFDDDALEDFARKHMANAVIQDIHLSPYHPESFVQGSAYQYKLTHVPLRDLDDAGLARLSREGHLFLSLDEMRAIRDHYQSLDREPTDIELETLAQTWSEHCVHKTLKSRVRLNQSEAAGMEIPGLSPDRIASRPGHSIDADGSIRIDNLLKSTVAAATFKLMEESDIKDWCISVFKDNAGIVKLDETDGVCIKVETHNHPSAIEPYGGAATGIGGCIRDIMGTGLAARPIANTDSFAVAFPDTTDLPAGVIHPRRVLQQVVAGVRDYGNRMGIPTVNGSVSFHPDYLGNPLVFAGCIGIIPLDKCFGEAKPGDRIIALGGRTGRDGIHGATFSSAELTDTHADEFAHAVQIGNAITQKKTLDAIMAARDHESGTLFSAITDCGAGGFSSAVGEMGAQIGARVELHQAPLKYEGLSYTEIWISEAQERMVLAVPPEKVATLQAICDQYDVELCNLGQFGWGSSGDNLDGQVNGKPTLALYYHEHEVGNMLMDFVHEGIPTPVREATWQATPAAGMPTPKKQSLLETLTQLMAHPDIASKHWIIRQYDHEVQGGSVVKPLVGPQQDGPSDAAVVRPKLGSDKGVALSVGLQTGLGEKTPGGDSYWMTLAAIDEAVRNAVCVGADPARIAILDNFCWPRCDDPAIFGSLVRAAEACYDGALAYRTPFVSGKDSLSNQFTTEDGRLITIPPTMLISAMGIVEDVNRCLTMDAKASGNHLLIIGLTDAAMGGSHYAQVADISRFNQQIPLVSLKNGPANAKAVASLIANGQVASAHDCSDGGMLVAAVEMAMAGRLGVSIDMGGLPKSGDMHPAAALFAQTPSRYLLEVAPSNLDAVVRQLREAKIAFGQLGSFTQEEVVSVRCPQHGRVIESPIAPLHEAWLGSLDW